MTRQIKVSDTVHENLNIVKKVNKCGSFDDTIRQMMQGCTTELQVIKRQQSALTLYYEGYINQDAENKTFDIVNSSELDITYAQLRKADVGDIFEPPLSDDEYYSYEIAQVVYTDSELVVLKITTYTEMEWYWDGLDIRMVGVQLF